MTDFRSLDRRTFIKTTIKTAAGAGSGLALLNFIPAAALGKAGRPAPSNRIVMGCIGVGGQGNSNLDSFLNEADCQVVAVCDVDKGRAQSTKNKVDHKYGNTDCTAYGDFRELLARPDIDVISMATPDHWHAITAIASLNSGRDVYGEKPLTHCLAEGRALVNAQIDNGRIWQTGSWQRSQRNFRYAAELVRNGRLGKVVRIEVGLPTGSPTGPHPFKDPPPDLDYDFWIGPSAWVPYCDERTHYQWRWQLEFGGGQMMDWIGHHGDIAHWGMGWDSTGPVAVEGAGEFPSSGIWDAPTKYHFIGTYKDGCEMHVANDQTPGFRMGTKWFGENGNWIWVDRSGIDANPKSLLDEKLSADEIHYYDSPGHQREFLDSVKTRRPPLAPAETAHRSASIGHLGLIAMQTGRKLRWNPDTEQFADDPIATRMLSTPMRAPWHV
jgi:predicted dehydrogenase